MEASDPQTDKHSEGSQSIRHDLAQTLVPSMCRAFPCIINCESVIRERSEHFHGFTDL